MLHSLSKSECTALKELLENDPIPDTKGISTPPEIDLIDTLDLDTCLRIDSPLNLNLSSLKKKSTTFPPPTTNANANLFLTQVIEEIEEIPLSKEIADNLSLTQRLVQSNLKNNKDLTIKPSDKGGERGCFRHGTLEVPMFSTLAQQGLV